MDEPKQEPTEKSLPVHTTPPPPPKYNNSSVDENIRDMILSLIL